MPKQRKRTPKSPSKPRKSLKELISHRMGKKHLRVRQEIEELQAKLGSVFAQTMSITRGFERMAKTVVQVANNQDRIIELLEKKFPGDLDVVRPEIKKPEESEEKPEGSEEKPEGSEEKPEPVAEK